MFEECLPTVGDNIWIVAEYYNLLSRQDKHSDIIRHFISILYRVGSTQIYLFQGGIYTRITNDNALSTDENFLFIEKMDDFCVP